MRIRKRQPLLLESTPPLFVKPLVNPVEDSVVGENSCTCCSRERQDWPEFKKQFAKEDRASSGQYFVRESVADGQGGTRTAADVRGVVFLSKREESGNILAEDCHDTEIISEEEEPKRRCAEFAPVGSERGRENEDGTKSKGGATQKYLSGNSRLYPEGDVDHPANNPRESLLYSLFFVFSKLSGKAVLTAREALSRLIEYRLPGLDEGSGLPSVQVAKVMRSNPYFVNIGGGKFFLWSGPSSRNDTVDEPETRDGMELEDRRTESSLIAPLTSVTITESSADEKRRVTSKDTPGKTSKGAMNVEDGTSVKLGSRSRVARKSYQPKTSVSCGTKDGTEASVRICKRYDGRGWKCNERALDGYSMCRHHHELIVNRLARLRSSGRLGSKKSVKKRNSGVKQHNEANAAEMPLNGDRAQWCKNVKARSLKSIND